MAEDFDLGFEETDAVVPTGGASSSEEVQGDVKPAQDRPSILSENHGQ
jgi:hypothetical protein